MAARCPRCGARVSPGDLDPATGRARCPLCGVVFHGADLDGADLDGADLDGAGPHRVDAVAGRRPSRPPPPGRLSATSEGVTGEVLIARAGLAPQANVLVGWVLLACFLGVWTWGLLQGAPRALWVAALPWSLALAGLVALVEQSAQRQQLSLGDDRLCVRTRGLLGVEERVFPRRRLAARAAPVEPARRGGGLSAVGSVVLALSRALSGGAQADFVLGLEDEEGELWVGTQLRPDELAWLIQRVDDWAR